MAARIRAYDVEPKPDRPELPSWAQDFTLDHIPFPGDEMRFDGCYWRVIRRTFIPRDDSTSGTHDGVILGVRHVSQ